MVPGESLVETRARELDVLSRAVIGTDAAGNVLYWNDAARDLYGWTSAEAVGRRITELTPTTQSREAASEIIEMLRRGHYWSGEFPVTRKDGATFVAHVIDAPVHDDAGQFVGIVGLSSDASPIVMLQRLARDLSAAAEPAEVARAALRSSMEAVAAAAGMFTVLEPDGRTLRTVGSLGYANEVIERFRSIPLDAPLPISIAVTTGEAIFVTSREEWKSRFPAVADISDPRTRAWVALPLSVGTRVVGAVGLSVRFPREFSAADRATLLAISQHAAVAVERALLFQAERAAREEAEQARAKAEEANRAKSAFLATMSHELRTPLGAIIGYHDLLAAEILGPINDEQRRHLERLRRSATHLLSLIDEVLTFSRLEAAREEVHPERCLLGQLVEEVSDIIRPLADAKGLAFECTVPNPAAELNSDAQKIRQILVNLAGNAVKYTSRGSVKIEYDVANGVMTAAVTDTGVGIRADHLGLVFDPFWQVESTRSRSSGGTGLGLSVARKLARLLGGDIEVRSTPGEGSTFTLRLPV